MARIDGVSLGAVFAGSLFVYAGLTGKSVPAAVQAIVQGRSPATAPQSQPITGGAVVPDVPIGGGSATGQQIATDALAYQGHCYSFGGAPGTSGTGCWDCSSYVNWVIGHDLGLAIPGIPAGGYDGSSHGPPTGAWLLWGGVTRIPKAQAQAGDIFCWETHMGIATGPDSMISAEDPANGTRVAAGNIAGFIPGEVLFVLRLKATLPPISAGGKR